MIRNYRHPEVIDEQAAAPVFTLHQTVTVVGDNPFKGASGPVTAYATNIRDEILYRVLLAPAADYPRGGVLFKAWELEAVL